MSLLSRVIPLFLVAACAQPPAPEVVSNPVKYPADNLADDTYNPGEGWTLAWADEFDGDTLNEANWNRQVVPAGRFNEEWQRYTDDVENSYIDAGSMVLKAVHTGGEHAPGNYTSARLNTAGKQSWTYGKVAARIQLPHGQGVWPAFWMLGANIDENGGDTPWPRTGEIDILELYGSKDDGVVEGNIHYEDASGEHAMSGPEAFHLAEGRFADAFHVFELEWTKEEMIWSVDGTPYYSTPIVADELSEFHQDFFLLFNIAIGGLWAGSPDEATPLPQYMYVDWVRVYQ